MTNEFVVVIFSNFKNFIDIGLQNINYCWFSLQDLISLWYPKKVKLVKLMDIQYGRLQIQRFILTNELCYTSQKNRFVLRNFLWEGSRIFLVFKIHILFINQCFIISIITSLIWPHISYYYKLGCTMVLLHSFALDRQDILITIQRRIIFNFINQWAFSISLLPWLS